MDRWAGRVAVVTGASSGIGAAVVKQLVQHGLKVVGLARRVERVQATADELKGAPGKLYAVKADVTKEEDLLAAFKWVKDNLGGVDVMINNAGIQIVSMLSDGKTSDWRQLIDVNVLALSICTREALKSMKERGVDDGHIIHINSILGHMVSNYPGIAVYTATKHAVTALTEGLRKELNTQKSHIKITSISPGAVYTELATNMMPEEELKKFPMLQAEDVAGAIMYTLSTPPKVQVHEITIKPIGEAM